MNAHESGRDKKNRLFLPSRQQMYLVKVLRPLEWFTGSINLPAYRIRNLITKS